MTEKQHKNHLRLKEISVIENRIINIEAQIYMHEQKECSPRAMKLKTVLVKGSLGVSDLSDYVVKLDELISKLIKEKERLYQSKAEILEAINKLDRDQAVILEQWYILQYPVWKICEVNHYGKSSVYNIRRKALSAISIPESEKG